MESKHESLKCLCSPVLFHVANDLQTGCFFFSLLFSKFVFTFTRQDSIIRVSFIKIPVQFKPHGPQFTAHRPFFSLLLPKASFSSPKKGVPAIRVSANILSTETRVPHSLKIYIQRGKGSKVNSLQQNLFFQSLSVDSSRVIFPPLMETRAISAWLFL